MAGERWPAGGAHGAQRVTKQGGLGLAPVQHRVTDVDFARDVDARMGEILGDPDDFLAAAAG
ncbi:MAG: hypothetical protein NZ533_11585 [Casimicrobiaceae bacterium]|nr:hypothetical protein [Casimicrobiaceae bacterium]